MIASPDNRGHSSFNFDDTVIIDLDPSDRNWELVDALQVKERAARICDHPYHVNCQLYMSLTSKAKSHGKHIDIADVFHWQQAGKTDFMVWEDGKKYTYTLLPGDCVFIPAGVQHDTLPRSPRFGLSIGIFPSPYEGGPTPNKTQEEIIAEFADKKDYTNVI